MTQAVLQVCLSKGWGGLEMYPPRISKWLPQNNWKPHALALKDGNIALSFKQNNNNCFEVTSTSDAILNIFKISNWIKKNNITIIHCHKSSDLKIAVLLKIITGAKIIFTEHMGGMRSKKDLFHKIIYRNVDKVLSISNETRSRNIRLLPISPKKIQTLWLGTEFKSPDISPDLLRAQLNIQKQDCIIGVPGRLCPGKGHLLMVDVIQQLRKYDQNIKLLIVGGLYKSEGADESFVFELQDKIKKLDLEESVIFTGYRSDMPNLYQIMDVVCIPSENEAFGLTAIEAMAAGRKIVASNAGALPEVLENSALFAQPNTVFEWIDQIKKLLSIESVYETLAKNRAKKLFSIELHCKKLSEVYSCIDVKLE